MNGLLKKAPLLLLILVIGLIGFVAYNTFNTRAFADDSSDLSSVSNTLIDPASAAVLAKIESIQLSTAIFSNPAFQSLQDYSVALPSESAGKANPFAPLGK